MDGPERRREAPYTFSLPHPDYIDALEVGDHAKVGFEYDPPGEKYGGERMWVLITEIDGDRYRGTLDNEPEEPILAHGDKVEFERKHILDVDYADGKAEPSVPPTRSYWARCLVDDCVYKDGVPVEYLYREVPEELEGHKHPDSGWRIRGKQGDATDQEMEEREASFVALGVVLNKDDSWLELIDAPIGSAFMRNFDADRYEPVEFSSSSD